MQINKIHNMDCLEGMKQMEDNYVDVIITSPPYNVCNSNFECVSDSKYEDYKDNLSDDDYFIFLSERITEMIRITSKYVFLNIQMLSGNKKSFIKLFSEFSDCIKDIMVWVKKNPAPNISPFVLSKSIEYIIVFDKDNQTGAYNKDKNIKRSIPDSFIKTVNSNNKYTDKHKAVFPNWLPQHFIKHFSDENDIILDPFNGVGTTTYYAKMYNRNFIGFDISDEYCRIAKKRLNQNNMTTYFK